MVKSIFKKYRNLRKELEQARLEHELIDNEIFYLKVNRNKWKKFYHACHNDELGDLNIPKDEAIIRYNDLIDFQTKQIKIQLDSIKEVKTKIQSIKIELTKLGIKANK